MASRSRAAQCQKEKHRAISPEWPPEANFEGGRTVAGDERAGKRRDTDPGNSRRQRLVIWDDALDVG